MNVLLPSGSPHPKGRVDTDRTIIAETLAEEGCQTMRTLARNMAHLLECREKSGPGLPLPREAWVAAGFIR